MRVALGAAAVLSPREAAALLQGRDEDELRWLYAKGLVREKTYPTGETGEFVLWSEVLRALEADRPAIPRPEIPKPRDRVAGFRRRSV